MDISLSACKEVKVPVELVTAANLDRYREFKRRSAAPETVP